MSQIECRDVALGYEGKIVVDDLTFSVEKGDYLCIVGENGAGKSTLIKALLGLKIPMSGEIIIDKELMSGGIGYLPQQSELQRDFPASVREIVISGCLGRMGIRPFYSKNEKIRSVENMEKMGILDLADKCYRDLSGGQQQRVLLARALCASEKILLLDEPASGLDPVAKNEMYDIVGELNKNYNITVVMVSHDIRSAVKHSKHILHISNKPLFFGETGHYEESDIGKAFLGDKRGGVDNV